MLRLDDTYCKFLNMSHFDTHGGVLFLIKLQAKKARIQKVLVSVFFSKASLVLILVPRSSNAKVNHTIITVQLLM